MSEDSLEAFETELASIGGDGRRMPDNPWARATASAQIAAERIRPVPVPVSRGVSAAHSAQGVFAGVQALRAAARGDGSKLLAAITVANAAMETYARSNELVGHYKRWRRERSSDPAYWRIAIKKSDYLYVDAQQWLLSLPLNSEVTNWLVEQEGDELVWSNASDDALTAEFGEHKIVFRTMNHSKTSNSDNGDSDESLSGSARGRGAQGWALPLSELEILVHEGAAFEAVKKKLGELVRKRERVQRPPTVYVYGSWGWNASYAPLRPLDTVVLDNGIKERVVADVERFLGAEMDYTVRGIPWHRGLMFWGPPGTGKTSLAKAVAERFGLDTYFLSLSSLSDDKEFFRHVGDVRSKSVLVLEDIDTASASGDREAAKPDGERKAVTAGALLSVLDGPHTPHGVIVIVTTNHPEKLDPAVVRPGRIDLTVELGWCTSPQASALYETFYGRAPEREFEVESGDCVSSATVTEIFKQHLYDAEGAETALHALLRDSKTADVT